MRAARSNDVPERSPAEGPCCAPRGPELPYRGFESKSKRYVPRFLPGSAISVGLWRYGGWSATIGGGIKFRSWCGRVAVIVVYEGRRRRADLPPTHRRGVGRLSYGGGGALGHGTAVQVLGIGGTAAAEEEGLGPRSGIGGEDRGGGGHGGRAKYGRDSLRHYSCFLIGSRGG